MHHPAPVRHRVHASIASYVPGRLRVRFHRNSRRPQELERTKAALAQHDGVQAVHMNPAAGSLTVHYDTQTQSGASILALLEDLDVLLGTSFDLPHIDDGDLPQGASRVALTLGTALDDLDRSIAAATGATLDLRTLFPLSLAGIGVWLIRRNGLMLEMAPGWLFLWLAFDAFVRLHPHAPVLQSAPLSTAEHPPHMHRQRLLTTD